MIAVALGFVADVCRAAARALERLAGTETLNVIEVPLNGELVKGEK